MTKKLDKLILRVKQDIIYDTRTTKTFLFLEEFKQELPKHYTNTHNINNITKVERLQVTSINTPEKEPLEEHIKQITEDTFKQIEQTYKKELEEVNSLGYAKIIQTGTHISWSLMQSYIKTGNINDFFTTGDIVPLNFKFFTPNEIYIITNNNNTFNITSAYKEIDYQSSRVQIADKNLDRNTASINSYRYNNNKLLNTSVVKRDDDNITIFLSDPNRDISTEFFLTKDPKELFDKVIFETAKYLIEPIFMKKMLDKNITTNIMPLTFDALIHTVINKLYSGKYTDFQRIINTNKELHSNICKLNKHNTYKEYLSESLKLLNEG